MICVKKLLTAISFFEWLVIPCRTASFYGASHLSVPLQDSKSTTDVYFKFLTHKPDAMLFLAAGPIDYCLVLLENGEIKVRINLGAGEAILTSPPGLRLNDLLWHEVELHRTDAELNLNIDNIHSTYLDIPGRFFELNVKFGVFVGGLGGFNDLFLGNLNNFRGCLEDLTFNDNDVLRMATENPNKRNIFGVTWDCSNQFEASSHQPISFVQRGSYATFPGWNSRTGGSISFDIKTQSSTAILFYNSGVPSKPDFVSLEIIKGKVMVSVNEGNGAVLLQSDIVVNDGIWHQVDVQFSPTYVEIAVDGQAKNLRPGLGDNRYFDLGGYLYVAGIEVNKQSRALQQGLKSVLSEGVDSSLKGCMKNIKMNNQLIGFREIVATQGVQTDCVWEYPCLQDPCIPGADCFQEGTDSFRCLCDTASCIRTNFSSGYKLYTKSSLPIDLEILTLKPLEISEGGSDLVTSEHIQVVLDYQKYGVRESGVLFHIIEPPAYGRLEIEIWRSADNIFTLLDLNTDKVRYSHGGSEEHRDTVTFELEFRARNYRLPVYLEQRHRFVFHIHISPVNDPPLLKLPPNKALRFAKNTKKVLSQDVLEAEDPDTSPSDLVYTILSLGSDNEGFVENAKSPGQPIKIFTQEEVNSGVISYVHKGQIGARIALRVSDGIETGQTAVLRVVVFDLALSLVNNTGLILPYDSSAIILPDNLTFVTNALDQNLEIRYDITRLPQYGTIQRFRGNERWQPVNHFTQRQIKKEKIRYLHGHGRPTYDDFKFVVSCGDLKMTTVYDFRITFIAVTLRRIVNKELTLERVLEGHLSDSEVKFETIPIPTPADQIIYAVVTPPTYGNLILFQSSNPEHRHKKLDASTSFTQQDVDSKHVKYKLHRRSYSAVSDNFEYRVNCTGGVSSDIMTFHIRHVPSETDATIVIEKLAVSEGERAIISKAHLHIETPKHSTMIYNVTSHPKHGTLLLLDTARKKTVDKSPLFFTTEQISSKRIIYAHDNSENDADRVQFVAHDGVGSDAFVYYGTLHINVIMKNDNPPTRAVDRPFLVVLNGERRLSNRIVHYVDIDEDSKPSDIEFTHRGISNGGLYHIDNLDTQIFKFTQDDIDKGRIIFRHTGEPYAKAVLWITDGQFYATGVLEIEASDPFLNVTSNTGLVVRRGENGLLTSSNLTVDTNLNVEPAEIIYKIVSPPKHGDILVGGRQLSQFSQKDLDEENIKYENDNSDVFYDSFQFIAYAENINVEDTFQIKVYPDIYWKPLQVINNKSVHVDEGKTVVIGPTVLQVAHININPSNITYIITISPKHGLLKLVVDANEHEDSEEKNTAEVNVFSQAEVDDMKLHYVQKDNNVSSDSFVFSVTNGITTLENLTFNINIISKLILLKTSNLTVLEGQQEKLTLREIGVASSYYENLINEYIVTEEPQHGHISTCVSPNSKLRSFQLSQLEAESICYVHDGSETSRDWFTLVANAHDLKKESAPSTIHVIIEPVNDETPHVVNNTGLEVWEGAITMITNRHLAAADDDSESEDVHFVISTPSNGYVAFKNDTKTPVLEFTQDQINRGVVVFVHTGEKAGGFRLQVNDGLNYGSPNVFTITSRSLHMIVEVNEKLSVLPRMQQSITADHLLVTTNDQDNHREIIYQVSKEPMLGRILLENPDGSLGRATQFTQDQIRKNMVLYEQTNPMSGLTATDTITFDVQTQHAESMISIDFQIEISVGNFGAGTFDQMMQLHPVVVKEGSNIAIGQEHIDLTKLMSLWQGKGKSEFSNRLRIVVLEPPSHGWIEIEAENLTLSRISFTREDLRRKRVFYIHDDSDTFTDSIILGFYLTGDTEIHDIPLFNGTLNITILPVNDQIFEVVTHAPRLDVVQGQRAPITCQNLNTTDADNVPSDIVYEIITEPKNGQLVYGINGSVPIHNFTQDDIDKSIVYFVHDGTNEPGVFHFKVSDGRHNPAYMAFNIYIVPLSLKLMNRSKVEILQGSTAAYLQCKNLGSFTNGNRDDIWYNVTTEPRYGRIFLGDDIVTEFKQMDIDLENVLYRQMDLTVSSDYFIVTVWNPENTIPDQIVNVSVVPLVKQKSFNTTSSSVTAITLEALDATKLAEQTKSNPHYTVFKGPKYGILQNKGAKRTRRGIEEKFNFTHNDVVTGKILYKSSDIDLRGSIVDSFEYVLSASNVQPAQGKFVIILQPKIMTKAPYVPTLKPPTEHDTISVSTTLSAHGPKLTTVQSVIVEDTDATTSDGETKKPFLSNDHLLIIGVAVGVVVAVIVVLIFVKCYTMKKRKKRNDRSTRKDGKVPGSHTAQTELDASDHLPSNGSFSLSDDLPPPAPPTSPSSTGSRSGNGTPHQRTLGARCKSGETSLPPPPYLTDGLSDWTEVSPTVPMCKVTPLSHHERPELGETTLKSPYDEDGWNHYDPGDIRYGPPGNLMLRKNQYWV